jgi:hypothetical protein
MIIAQCTAYWKQRSKFRVLRDDDANTSFFHA